MIQVRTDRGRAVLLCLGDHGPGGTAWRAHVHAERLPDALRMAIAHVHDDHDPAYGTKPFAALPTAMRTACWCGGPDASAHDYGTGYYCSRQGGQ